MNKTKINLNKKTRKYKFLRLQPAIYGLVVWYVCTWLWSLQTDSLNLAGNKTQGLVFTVAVLIINTTVNVLVMWQFIRFINNYSPKLPRKLAVPLIIVVMAFADYMVAWVPAAMWAGPQGRLDSIYPINSPALLLIHTPLVFAGRLIGYFGLAAFVWATVYLLCIKKLRNLWYVPLLVLSIISLTGRLLYSSTDNRQIKATIVSERIVERTKPIKYTGQDLIIFPEYGLEKINDTNLKDRIDLDSIKDKKVYFLGSEQVYKPERAGHENRMMFGNNLDGITHNQDKFRLIPGGEDMPYLARTLLRATGQVSTLDYFSYAKGVITGHEQLKNLTVDDNIQIGAALCSSIIAPQDYRYFTRHGANILTNSASLTTFKGALFNYDQHALGTFMAVANSRYFLQSANSANSYAIDNNGHMYANIEGIKTLDVIAKTNTRKTLYTYVGEWMVWLGGYIFVAVMLIRWKQTWKFKRKTINNKEV